MPFALFSTGSRFKVSTAPDGPLLHQSLGDVGPHVKSALAFGPGPTVWPAIEGAFDDPFKQASEPEHMRERAHDMPANQDPARLAVQDKEDAKIKNDDDTEDDATEMGDGARAAAPADDASDTLAAMSDTTDIELDTHAWPKTEEAPSPKRKHDEISASASDRDVDVRKSRRHRGTGPGLKPYTDQHDSLQHILSNFYVAIAKTMCMLRSARLRKEAARVRDDRAELLTRYVDVLERQRDAKIRAIERERVLKREELAKRLRAAEKQAADVQCMNKRNLLVGLLRKNLCLRYRVANVMRKVKLDGMLPDLPARSAFPAHSLPLNIFRMSQWQTDYDLNLINAVTGHSTGNSVNALASRLLSLRETNPPSNDSDVAESMLTLGHVSPSGFSDLELEVMFGLSRMRHAPLGESGSRRMSESPGMFLDGAAGGTRIQSVPGRPPPPPNPPPALAPQDQTALPFLHFAAAGEVKHATPETPDEDRTKTSADAAASKKRKSTRRQYYRPPALTVERHREAKWAKDSSAHASPGANQQPKRVHSSVFSLRELNGTVTRYKGKRAGPAGRGVSDESKSPTPAVEEGGDESAPLAPAAPSVPASKKPVHEPAQPQPKDLTIRFYRPEKKRQISSVSATPPTISSPAQSFQFQFQQQASNGTAHAGRHERRRGKSETMQGPRTPQYQKEAPLEVKQEVSTPVTEVTDTATPTAEEAQRDNTPTAGPVPGTDSQTPSSAMRLSFAISEPRPRSRARSKPQQQPFRILQHPLRPKVAASVAAETTDSSPRNTQYQYRQQRFVYGPGMNVKEKDASTGSPAS